MGLDITEALSSPPLGPIPIGPNNWIDKSHHVHTGDDKDHVAGCKVAVLVEGSEGDVADYDGE